MTQTTTTDTFSPFYSTFGDYVSAMTCRTHLILRATIADHIAADLLAAAYRPTETETAHAAMLADAVIWAAGTSLLRDVDIADAIGTSPAEQLFDAIMPQHI